MTLRKTLTVVLLLGIAINTGFSIGFSRRWTGGVVTALAQEGQPGQEENTPENISETPEIPGDTTILTIASVGLVLIVMVGVLWHSRSQKFADLGEEKSSE